MCISHEQLLKTAWRGLQCSLAAKAAVHQSIEKCAKRVRLKAKRRRKRPPDERDVEWLGACKNPPTLCFHSYVTYPSYVYVMLASELGQW